MPSPKSPTRSSAARSRAGSPAGRAGLASAGRGGEALAGIDRGLFPRTLYLDGPSEPLKAAILHDLRHAWAQAFPAAPPARVLRAAESSVEEVLAAHQGGSLFDPRELTLVFEVEDFAASEKRVTALAEGLRRPAGESTLVLVESEAEKPRKSLDPLRAACEARVSAEPPDRAALLAWGARRLAREQLTAEPSVLEAIADACEGDALAFFSELARLTGFAGAGGRLTRADCAALLRPAVGAGITDYLAAVSAGNAALAARRLGRLLAAGESEGTVLFALTNLVGGALGGWARSRELSAALRSRCAPARLLRSLDALYRAEAAWKGGRADAIAVLEQATRVVAAR
jgi:DNA polymerase III delta subunit